MNGSVDFPMPKLIASPMQDITCWKTRAKKSSGASATFSVVAKSGQLCRRQFGIPLKIARSPEPKETSGQDHYRNEAEGEVHAVALPEDVHHPRMVIRTGCRPAASPAGEPTDHRR